MLRFFESFFMQPRRILTTGDVTPGLVKSLELDISVGSPNLVSTDTSNRLVGVALSGIDRILPANSIEDYHEKANGSIELKIVDDKLFYQLKETYKAKPGSSSGRDYSPGLADSPDSLLASAVNLLRFITDNGLEKIPNIKFQIRPRGNKNFATLTCRNQDGEIEYTLEGIKDLPNFRSPKYAFKIIMDRLGQISIKLEGTTLYPSLLVHEDGSYKSPVWLQAQQISNQSNLEVLKKFIKAQGHVLSTAIRDKCRTKISGLAINDNADLKPWNHIETFEKMSVPKMLQSLLKEVETIKAYCLEHKPAESMGQAWWNLDASNLISKKYTEDIVDKSVLVKENKEGAITEFKITSSKRILNSNRNEPHAHPYEYLTGYEMNYKYDEKSGLMEIEKTQPDGKILKLSSNKEGKVTLKYDTQRNYSFRREDFISPTIVDSLLGSIFFNERSNPRKSDEDLKIQAQSLIDVINKLKLQESENLVVDFNGYKLRYQNLIDSEIYSLEKDGTKIEVELKFDNTTEFRLTESSRDPYTRIIDANGRVLS